MGWIERRVNGALRALACITIHVGAGQLDRFPPRAPLILVVNQINIRETRRVFERQRPHPMTGFAKGQLGRDPVVGRLSTNCGVTPPQREPGVFIQAKGVQSSCVFF